ncbi:hypothetical protein C8R48DRAFT_671121 [Suillus tomentosus]|nr:hypothetical protein C8R48DRAFT_671121 [Suillus tomentosus]
MLFHSVAILACTLSIAAHAAASPTASVDALDQRDGLMVRVDVDATKSSIGDVLDNVNLSQKRNDVGLIGVDVGYALRPNFSLNDSYSLPVVKDNQVFVSIKFVVLYHDMPAPEVQQSGGYTIESLAKPQRQLLLAGINIKFQMSLLETIAYESCTVRKTCSHSLGVGHGNLEQ